MLRNALHNPSRLIDPDFIRRLVAQGVPQEKDYPDLNAWLTRAHALGVNLLLHATAVETS